jgi:hypothetical protein
MAQSVLRGDAESVALVLKANIHLPISPLDEGQLGPDSVA